MPLVPTVAQSLLISAFKQKSGTTPQLAASRMAQAYTTYVRTAMALSYVPIFTGTEQKKLEAMLLTAIATPAAGSPPTLALAWANGLVAFWSAPPVAFAGLGVGVVANAFVIPSIVIPGLTAAFSNLSATEEITAATMATVLDAATRTVMVLITPPPPAVPFLSPLL